MHADLTVIDADLFRAPPPAVLKARIVATIVAGRVAYER
jgi:predicted amidohydrolase YtcJ